MHHKRLMMRAKSKRKFKVRFGEPPLQRTRGDGQAFKPTREPRVVPGPATRSLHIRVRALAIFSDEAVDPRRDYGQRYRAELEHSITLYEVRIKKDELRSR